MTKFPRTLPLARSIRLKTHGCIALFLLGGCTATQVRWDATNIRKEVMVYYNDQIMDNLIRAKNNLPFVHVDITLLTSQGSSQISGTVGYGETITNTGTNALTTQTTTTNVTGMSPTGPSSMHQVARVAGGLLESASHVAMRPFTYSVTPQQTETLSIQAAPALGSGAIVSMSGKMVPTKVTEESWEMKKTGADNTTETKETSAPEEDKPKKITKEKTQTPVTITIYELYESFARSRHLLISPARPDALAYVPGTLKRWDDGQYYYIPNNERDKRAYYKFCQQLFTKGQSQTGGLERALQQTQAAAALR
jgi:hypothetical protein